MAISCDIDELGLYVGSEVTVDLVMELVTSKSDIKRKIVALEEDSAIFPQSLKNISRLAEEEFADSIAELLRDLKGAADAMKARSDN